jgi:hypothetical protein
LLISQFITHPELVVFLTFYGHQMIRQKVVLVLSIQQLYTLQYNLEYPFSADFILCKFLFQELSCLNYIPVYNFHNTSKEQLHMQ